MSQLDREGVFHARAIERGIDETGKNNLTTLIVKFEVFEEKQPDGSFAACEGQHITSWQYMECKNGSLNTFTIDALKAAFGWDGADPFWLSDDPKYSSAANVAALSTKPVQITCEFETFEEKERLKVQWLNPYGSTSGGGVTRADDATAQAIKNRLGARFRANAGGTSVQTPKPAGAPTAPPAAKAPAPTVPACTMDDAWAAFAASGGGKKLEQKDLEREWFRIVGELFPGREMRTLSGAEWARVREDGPSQIIPL